jgi:DNA-binding XRE family transcriptional regulator
MSDMPMNCLYYVIYFLFLRSIFLKGFVLSLWNNLTEVNGMECRIEELILERGLKKGFVAKKVGVTPRQLRNYEKGISYPPIDKAYILADLLGVKVDDLYSRIED